MQIDALKRAGVEKTYEEKRSGGDRKRPILEEVLARLQPGDTFVVYKLDRVARSLSHLLEILDRIEKAGASFLGLTEVIDTKSPAGRMMMQIIGAFAEFERELIRERTRASMKAALERGAKFGRPFMAFQNQNIPKCFGSGTAENTLKRHWPEPTACIYRASNAQSKDIKKNSNYS